MAIIVTKVLLTAVTLLVVAEILPGINVSSVYIAVITAIILGFLNLTVKPILILLTLPVSIMSMGFFLFIINALLFWFASSFIQGFEVNNFWYALLGSLLVSLASILGNRFLLKTNRGDVDVKIIHK